MVKPCKFNAKDPQKDCVSDEDLSNAIPEFYLDIVV